MIESHHVTAEPRLVLFDTSIYVSQYHTYAARRTPR
jgi:hypothetical protein